MLQVWMIAFTLANGTVSEVQFTGDFIHCQRAGRAEVMARKAVAFECKFTGTVLPGPL